MVPRALGWEVNRETLQESLFEWGLEDYIGVLQVEKESKGSLGNHTCKL